MALPRKRGPMSLAQKAALKKAQEISARKRRGTGKIELAKPRKAAAPEKPTMPRKAAAPEKKSGGRVTLQELARRSQSGPQPKARALSDYQKTDSAIFKERQDKLVKLENDYASGRITKRKFDMEKKKLDAETKAKRDANIKANNRDERGNPKPKSSMPEYPNEGPDPKVRKGVRKPPRGDDDGWGGNKAGGEVPDSRKAVLSKTYLSWVKERGNLDPADQKTLERFDDNFGLPENEYQYLKKEFTGPNARGARPKGNSSIKPQKPSSTAGSVKAKNGQEVKVGDAVNIGTGGQVWRITGIDGDTVTAKGILQLNANSKVERKFKASQISERRDEDRFKDSTAAKPNSMRPADMAAKSGKSPMGTADPGTLGVSQILKERKELIAKRNGEGLTPEESKRLVAIQAESALRHQNRKAGKGTGPTKVALGNISQRGNTEKPSAGGNISQRSENPDQKDVKKLTDQELKDRLDKLDKLDKQMNDRRRKYADDPEELASIRKRKDRINEQWDEASMELFSRKNKADAPKASESTKKKLASSVQVGDTIRRADGDREVVAVERRPDGSYRFTTKMKNSQGTGEFNADRNEQLDVITASTKANDANSAKLGSTKATKDQEWAAKRYGGSPEEYWFDKKTWNLVNGNPKTRDPNTTVSEIPGPEYFKDSDEVSSMPQKHRSAIWNARDVLRGIADKNLERDNVLKELNSAKTVGDMIEAAQSVYWYLDEWDGMGRNTSEIRREVDKAFETLKKFSSRYRQKSTAGVRQPTFNRRTRMSGRG